MMQRLLFEEAQQSSYAITPARESAESRDESQSESLAAEFQNLLAQIVGQVGAGPDQGIALGIALAQTMAPVRIRQPEEVKAEQRDGSAQPDSKDLMEDSDSRSEEGVSNLVDNRGETNRGARRSVGGGTETDAEQHIEQIAVATVESQAVEEEITKVLQGALSQERDPSLSNEHKKIEAAGSLVTQQLVTDTGKDYSPGEQVVLGHKELREVVNAGAEKVVSTSRITVKQEKSSESLEDASDEVLLTPTNVRTSDELALRENVRKSQSGQKTKVDGTAHIGSGVDASDERTAHYQRYAAESSETGATGQVDNLNLGQHQGAVERVKKSATNEGDPKGVQSEQPLLPQDTKRNESRSDGAIQMVLLRQAFESLRAARSDIGDAARLRSQPQSVQAVGTAAEIKSAQGEQTSRGKPLTRPQVARMMERVESTLKEAARSRNGKTLSLHLEPVDLGKVKVDVSLREGTLHARITPENQQVVQALREHSHELQSALRRLGLEVDSVTVSVTAEEFAGQMTTDQEMMDGRSFQHERNNMPHERAQVPETTIGNELALRSKAGVDSERSEARNVTDHWIA